MSLNAVLMRSAGDDTILSTPLPTIGRLQDGYMRHWKLLAAAVLAVGPLVSAGTAGATPPEPVTLTVDTIFVPGSVDEFASSGGVVCASGEVTTPWSLFAGGQNGFHGQLLVAKHFVCDEGTFDA